MASRQHLEALADEATAIAMEGSELSAEERERKLDSLAAAIRRAAENAPLTSDDLWREARAIAQSIADESEASGASEPGELSERIDQVLDGHAWTIYTRRAQQLIAASRFDDAAIEEIGADAVADDTGIRWDVLAYFALRAEVLHNLVIVECPKCGNEFAQGPDSIQPTSDDGEECCHACAALFTIPDDARIVTYKETIVWHDEEDPDGYQEETEDGPTWDAEEIRDAIECAQDFGEALGDGIVNAIGLGILEASCSPWQLGSWFVTEDDENFQTGERSRYSVHVKGLTPEQETALARYFLPSSYFGKA